MKHLILVFAAAMIFASCTKQASVKLAPEKKSSIELIGKAAIKEKPFSFSDEMIAGKTKPKTQASLSVNPIFLSATYSNNTIICIDDFNGNNNIDVSQLQRRYTDQNGVVQTITFNWEDGTTTQSGEWAVVHQVKQSLVDPDITSYTISDCIPFGDSLVSGSTFNLRTWVAMWVPVVSGGLTTYEYTVIASNEVTVVIP